MTLAVASVTNMKISPQISLKFSVIFGFAVILFLAAMLAVLGLLRIAESNRQVEQIVSQNNVKTELIHAMKKALRERMSWSHLMPQLQDEFKQNAAYLSFGQFGAEFGTARAAFEEMPLRPEEKEILTRVRQLTLQVQPFVTDALELAMNGNTAAANSIIESHIIDIQKLLDQKLDKLLELQRRATEVAVSDAGQAFEKTRLHMLLLGSLAIGLGLLITPMVIRKANSQAQALQQQVMFDSLTNLPNHMLFADRMRHAVLTAHHEQRSFGLFAIHVDRFQAIHERFGHTTGDQVLQFVAACIQSCLNEPDTLARIEGDKFGVLRMNMNDPDDAIEIVKRIRATISEPFEISGQRLKLAASVGVAMFPYHGDDSDTLFHAAHSALDVAQHTPRGYRIYSADMAQGADDRIALLAELRQAIENDEFILHYQPKIDFKIGKINGVEVLVRWSHPTDGLLSPERFIPLAEQTGLIKPLTLLVFNAALRQHKDWSEAGFYLPMSVKVPAVNLQDPEFPQQISDSLKEHDLPAQNFEIEVKESDIIANLAPAMAGLRKLHDLGFQIAIGDFGSGQSSMSHLTELVVANIKLNKSLVMDMASSRGGAMMMRTTVKLGHSLGLKVVASGVEDQGSWDTLKGFGCDSAQGFYMSHPLPPGELLNWVHTSQWGRPANMA